MENRFMDVDYFVIEAANSTQKEFELDYADVIEVFDTNETHLTTEDRRKLIINWTEDGRFNSYFVAGETAQMTEGTYVADRVNQVIKILTNLTLNDDCVDGETMQYILEKVGMHDQMLRQLVMTQPIEEVRYLIEEREEFEEEFEYEGDIEDLQVN